MANEFTSAAFHIGEPTDSRILSLRAGFCALTQQQVNELARRMKRFMDESLPELCLSWNNDGKKRREKDVKREIECGVCGINGAFLSFDGFIRSELVYNASSLKKAKNALLCPTLPQRYDNCAADYPEYYEKHISGVLNDPERLGHQKYPPLAHRFCRTPALACLSNIRTYRRSLCLFCFSYFPPPWAVPATDMNVVRGSARKSEHCGEPELNCL